MLHEAQHGYAPRQNVGHDGTSACLHQKGVKPCPSGHKVIPHAQEALRTPDHEVTFTLARSQVEIASCLYTSTAPV